MIKYKKSTVEQVFIATQNSDWNDSIYFFRYSLNNILSIIIFIITIDVVLFI